MLRGKRSFPGQDISQTDIFPDRRFPDKSIAFMINGRFPDRHFPGQTIPGQDVSRNDISRTGRRLLSSKKDVSRIFRDIANSSGTLLFDILMDKRRKLTTVNFRVLISNLKLPAQCQL